MEESVDIMPAELWRALLLASMTDDACEFYDDSPLWYDDYDEK